MFDSSAFSIHTHAWDDAAGVILYPLYSQQ